MSYPLIIAGVAAAALFLPGCDWVTSEEQASQELEGPEPPKKDSPKPTEIKCPGSAHSLNFGSQDFTLCHEDPQKDGIYQSATDHLWLNGSDGLISSKDSKAWEKIRKQFGLPIFEKLNISKWQKAHKFVFPNKHSWTKELEGSLSGLMEYAQQKAISLDEPLEIAESVKQGNSREADQTRGRIVSLAMGILLASLHKDSENSFYQRYKTALDTISSDIKKGELTLKSLPIEDQFNPIVVSYDSEDNTIEYPPNNMTLRGPDGESALLHELLHFYQDMHLGCINQAMGEEEASLLEADFLISQSGLEREDLRSMSYPSVLKLLSSRDINEAEGEYNPVFVAIRARYHNARNESEEEQKTLTVLRKQLKLVNVISGFWASANKIYTPEGQARWEEKVAPHIIKLPPQSSPEEKIREFERVISEMEREIESIIEETEETLSEMDSGSYLTPKVQDLLIGIYLETIEMMSDLHGMKLGLHTLKRPDGPFLGSERDREIRREIVDHFGKRLAEYPITVKINCEADKESL